MACWAPLDCTQEHLSSSSTEEETQAKWSSGNTSDSVPRLHLVNRMDPLRPFTSRSCCRAPAGKTNSSCTGVQALEGDVLSTCLKVSREPRLCTCNLCCACNLMMASSLHLCALPPTSGSLSPSYCSPPGLAIRLSVVTTVQAFHRGARRSSCKRPGHLAAAASGDEAAAAAAGGGSLEEDLQDLPFDITRLEQYTEKVKNEVLRVHAVVDGEEDRVIIFKVSGAFAFCAEDSDDDVVVVVVVTFWNVTHIGHHPCCAFFLPVAMGAGVFFFADEAHSLRSCGTGVASISDHFSHRPHPWAVQSCQSAPHQEWEGFELAAVSNAAGREGSLGFRVSEL
jgi:hypothetical protein